MATLVNALNAEFTPAVGTFIAQVTGGTADLMRKDTSGAAFAKVGQITNQAVNVTNPVAGAVYKFVSAAENPVVQADQ